MQVGLSASCPASKRFSLPEELSCYCCEYDRGCW